jgi:glucose-6-phosphate 1-epimerase
MVDRQHKPGPLAATPTFAPQAAVNASEDRVSARLPTGESIDVLLYGATVISWKTAAGTEKLWLSDAAKLDGSKPVRGGIPLVFPVFGTAPDHEATSKLPSHGFARATKWDFLSRGADGDSSESVRLDFGLSNASLDEKTRAQWPYAFDLVYSVTLERDGLTTSLVVNNKEESAAFEVQALFHSYFRVGVSFF